MTNARGALSERVQQSHAKLSRELGRPPTAVELFAAVGEDVGRNTNNVRMAAAKRGLALTRVRATNGAKTKRARSTNGHAPINGEAGKFAPPPVNPAKNDDASPPSLGTAGYLAIMALQAERQRIAAELAVVDKVIERLRTPAE